MAKTAVAGVAVGMYHVSIGRVDSNGYFKGLAADPDTIANGTALNPLHLEWADSHVPAQATQSIHKTQGGQKPGPQTPLGINDRGEATLTLALDNESLDALIQGYDLDVTTISDWAIGANNPREETYHSYMAIISSRFSTDGTEQDEWFNYIYTNARITKTTNQEQNQADGTNPNMVTYTIAPNESTRTPFGTLLSASNLNISDNKTDVIKIRSDNPLGISSYVATTSDSGWTLPFLPTTADVLQASNATSLDGVIDNWISISITTGAIVTAAMTDAEIYQILYETAFQTV